MLNEPTGLERIILVVDTGKQLDHETRLHIQRSHPYVRIVRKEGYDRFFERSSIPRFASIALHEAIHKDAVDILSEQEYAAEVQRRLEAHDLDLHEFDATVTYPTRIDATPAELSAHLKTWYERSLKPKIRTTYAIIDAEAHSPTWIDRAHARRTSHR